MVARNHAAGNMEPCRNAYVRDETTTSDDRLPAREAMEFDVVIVGAGPAGLAAAIRLKQLSPEHRRRGGREGLRGRRPYPLRRGDRSDRPRPAAAGLAQRGHADQDRGHRRPLLLARASRRAAAAELPDAAADEQPRQLHRLARQRLPLARHQGRGARRRDLSGLRRRRGAVRRERRGRRRRHRRHGHRQGRQAARTSFTRGMELRAQIHAVRRRRARQSDQDADRALRARPRAASRRNSASA